MHPNYVTGLTWDSMGHSMVGWKPPDQLGKVKPVDGPPVQKLMWSLFRDGTMPLCMYAYCTVELLWQQRGRKEQQKCWGWRPAEIKLRMERGSMEMGATPYHNEPAT